MVGESRFQQQLYAGEEKEFRHSPLLCGGVCPDTATRTHLAQLLTDGLWRRGFALLGRYGLGFELQVPWWHLHETLDLTRIHPHIPITINHSGLPYDRSKTGLSGWAAALRSVAAQPQVNIKISCIGLAGVPWSVPNNRVIVEQVMDIFGPDRIMFASNFPVDGLTGSFADIYGGYLEITKDWSDYEQSAAFIGNAVRHYYLDLSTRMDSDQESSTLLTVSEKGVPH